MNAKKFLLILASGYVLHIAALEVADIFTAQRFMACAKGDTAQCILASFGYQNKAEQILRYRPGLAQMWFQAQVRQMTSHNGDEGDE